MWIGADVEVSSPSELELGSRVRLERGTRLLGKVSLGSETTLRQQVLLDARGGKITLGRNCSVNEFCVFYGMGGLTIGDDVRFATHTVIVTGNHNVDDLALRIRDQGVTVAPVTIGDDVWIAANVTILAGVEIGAGAVIGAGSVVTKSIPSMAIAAGVPATVIRERGTRSRAGR